MPLTSFGAAPVPGPKGLVPAQSPLHARWDFQATCLNLTVARRQGAAKRKNVRNRKVGKKLLKVKKLGPDLTNVRRFLKGATHRKGAVETRGVKRTLTDKQLQKLDATRARLHKEGEGEKEVHWDDIMEKAGLAGVVDATTAARNLRDAGYELQARPPRAKPCRTDVLAR